MYLCCVYVFNNNITITPTIDQFTHIIKIARKCVLVFLNIVQSKEEEFILKISMNTKITWIYCWNALSRKNICIWLIGWLISINLMMVNLNIVRVFFFFFFFFPPVHVFSLLFLCLSKCSDFVSVVVVVVLLLIVEKIKI